ncbi:MAG: iron ABC transporter permease [Magnetococcales bacterium]|nr:iron ABC transporter permease [Magnetococcales bacterium]
MLVLGRWILLVGLLLLSLFLALSYGSVPVLPLLQHPDPSQQQLGWTILWQLRLPRLVHVAVVGASLALSGGLLQVLLRNPLADPYILGVSGGASCAALLALSLGWQWSSGHVELAAMTGALVAMAAVLLLCRGASGWQPARLLLTGAALSSVWSALITLLLTLSADGQTRGLLFWLMGDFDEPGYPVLLPIVLVISLLLLWPQRQALNLLAQGELLATTLGVAVKQLSWLLYLTASLLVAAAVTSAGGIGFIGLITPHLMRLLGWRDHRILLPALLPAGAILLLWADTIARTAWAPQQLPIGAITALLGAPFFLLLLRRS